MKIVIVALSLLIPPSALALADHLIERVAGSREAKYTYPLDAHFHFDFSQPPADHEIFLSQTEVKSAFLISPSFRIINHPDTNGIHLEWYEKLENVNKVDGRAAAFVQANESRFIGLCGLNYTWEAEFAITALKSCLSMPGMRGIKMHSFATLEHSSLHEGDVAEKVKTILSRLKSYRPFVLWHLETEGGWPASAYCDTAQPECRYQELKNAVAVIRALPEITFIFAHSLFVPAALERLMEMESKQGELGNLFLETSRVRDTHNWRKLFVEFGLDRVIYGSDNFIDVVKPTMGSELRRLKSEFGFTGKELNQILIESPRRLLAILGKE